ncbi:MAG TPA: GNAT family N-acetyltransferase [Kofleriaceae bacterium]|nr:GNAT family N-acetyltransferase [Kofleriaceae bacterium]
MSRFAIRQATHDDAAAVARAQLDSWRSSYRGILPDAVLDKLDISRWTDSRRRIAADGGLLQLVAYDLTHGDIVGFCDAGPSRRGAEMAGEVYALYLVQHAKRHGLGSELLDHTISWLRAHDRRSMIIWVLENNHHARRFYEVRGGELGGTVQSHVHGFPVVERAYLWRHL